MSKRILLIDDEIFYCRHIKGVLLDLGADDVVVDHAQTFEEGIEQVSSGSTWDLYLVDLHFRGSEQGGGTIIQKLLTAVPLANMAICTNIDLLQLEAELLQRISTGRVTFLEKMRSEKMFLKRFLLPERKKQMDLLLLEDDADDAHLAAQMLKEGSEGGIQCTLASTIQEAEAAMRKQWFDGFIIDYYLEGETRNGMDFYRELTQEDRLKPAVLLTQASPIDLDKRTMRLISHGQLKFMSKDALNRERLTACFLQSA